MNTAEKLKSLAIERDPPAASGGAGPWPMIAGAAVLAAAAIGGWAIFMKPSGEAPKPVAAQTSTPDKPAATNGAPPATAAPAALPRSRGGLIASGYVVARRSATVSVDITGRLTEVLFEEGAVVEKGQLLARLDDSLAQYDLKLAHGRVESAKANIASLKAQMVQASADRQRNERLIKSDAVSRSNYDSAVARINSLTAQYEAAKSDAAVAELAARRQAEFVERHRIRAPFAGVIIAKNAQSGEILSPAAGGGQFTRTGVATLVDMDSLEVEVDVNEGQIADVRAGQKATVVLDAYTDWAIPGEVLAIIPTANRDRATIKVRVGMKVRDPRILPQMAAKVTFDRSAG